jgi:hypothetical protein
MLPVPTYDHFNDKITHMKVISFRGKTSKSNLRSIRSLHQLSEAEAGRN